jgi:aquaporin Z
VEPRRLVAEALGTALLVFFAVGTATLNFGFKVAGGSAAAGVTTTALAFGLVLMVLAYALGPLSGCHINPAVTIGFLVSRRMTPADAAGYLVAQVLGGIAGALGLWLVLSGSSMYSRDGVGLGTDGYDAHSLIHVNAAGALAAEVVLTFLFVLVVLEVTSRGANAVVAGMVIGFALTAVHLVGIPITGTSVNPARSIGPALIVGGDALSQLWVFILAPLVGGALAAVAQVTLLASSEAPATTEQSS